MKKTKFLTHLLALSFVFSGAFALSSCDTFSTKSLEYELLEGEKYSFTITGITTVESSITVPKDYNGFMIAGVSPEAFKGYSNLKKLKFLGDALTIGESAFEDCISLEKVVFYGDVISIEDNAFSNCKKLKKAVFKGEYLELGSYAFSNCTSLQSIELPTGINEISERIFSGCTSLTSISIPKTVQYIHLNAFAGTSLTDIYYEGSKEEWENVKIDFVLFGPGSDLNITVHHEG